MAMSLDELEPPYLIVKPGLSEEDFYRLAGEDSDWEYLDGRIVVHSPASDRHEDLQGFLLTLLRFHAGKRSGAAVRGSRYPMRLDPAWSPEPDVLVVAPEHRDRVRKQRLEGPADLVVEVVSESDAHVVYREKLPRYREAGIAEVWIVDPFRREVLTDRTGPAGRVAEVVARGRVDSTVLEGFWIEADWLWRDDLPPPHECLAAILGE